MIRFDLTIENGLELADERSNIMTTMADVKKDYFVGSIANIIVQTSARSELVEMQWGLIPHFAQDPDYGKKYGFNAWVEGSKNREGIENMRTFRESIQARSCIIPVSTYFEQWDGHWWGFCPNKRPYFPLAGIYYPWLDKPIEDPAVAAKLAMEMFILCPDAVDQSTETVGAHPRRQRLVILVGRI
jgi:putative SOS response-associated peptidase YedK